MTVLISRNSIANALFAVVDAAAGKVASVQSSSRQLVPLEQVDSPQMPAIFLVQRGEQQVREVQGMPGIGLPAKRFMRFEVWIYTSDAQSSDTVSADQINDIVDSVEDALQPDNVMTGTLTLAGLAWFVRIDGNVEYYLNVQGGPKSVAIVPVTLLRP